MYTTTVGVCCYRQKRRVYRCLRSLASQTVGVDDFEVVLVNDEPGESLVDVCETFSSDSLLNIRLINNARNLGLPASLNRILEVARGRYFVRVDADDYVSRHFLYVLSLFLRMNREYQAVTCDYKKVDEVGNAIVSQKFVEEPIACGVMFNYEALCNLEFYNEEYAMREGHELLKRFQRRYQICHLPFALYRYRMHEENRTNDKELVEEFDARLGK